MTFSSAESPVKQPAHPILVCDDSAVDRRLIRRLLEQSGEFEVVECGDGMEAQAILAHRPVDLVVTDLAMPGCDGLQLVCAIKRRWPALPVVLVTGVGSEQTAMEALRAGAASYSPKSALARDLARTVEFVLEVAAHSRGPAPTAAGSVRGGQAAMVFEQQPAGWGRSLTGHILDNDCRMIGPLIEHLQQQLPDWPEPERMQIGMAVAEALTNAMVHGNLEVPSRLRCEQGDRYPELIRERRGELPWAARKVHISSELDRDQVRIRIRDEGPGFDEQQVPDPTAPENLTRLGGRGLMLIRSFMDEVRVLGRGNEIEMLKRRSLPG